VDVETTLMLAASHGGPPLSRLYSLRSAPGRWGAYRRRTVVKSVVLKAVRMDAATAVSVCPPVAVGLEVCFSDSHFHTVYTCF